MLKDWMPLVKMLFMARVLYLMPVNNPRLPGGKREAVRISKALLGVKSAERLTVLTTMWDLLGSDTGMNRAECNFIQLQEDFWKDYVNEGTKFLKFHNTQHSALSILNEVLDRSSLPIFMPKFNHIKLAVNPIFSQNTVLGASLYKKLNNRIQNVRVELCALQDDLERATERGDEQLASLLMVQLEQSQKLLATFEQEKMRNLDPALPFSLSTSLPQWNEETYVQIEVHGAFVVGRTSEKKSVTADRSVAMTHTGSSSKSHNDIHNDSC
ncbi:hypothetical protein BJ165DRAFT_1558957 [Panaeolus papilionaceus]|nr:hypothetical protein BJ165DRAFT_1558957 [Panaeolus papilionaceus]